MFIQVNIDADEHDVDAIGMSGLFVKSTLVMKDNLLEPESAGALGAVPRAAGGARSPAPSSSTT